MPFNNPAFIVNPHARNGTTRISWQGIRASVQKRIGNFRTFITDRPGGGTAAARTAISDGCRTLVCVGGDGTLNEVLNGIMAYPPSVRSEIVMGCFPNGTGCDFVRSVGIPRDMERALDLLVNPTFQRIDVGSLMFRDSAGTPMIRYFHNIASFGLGGEVDQRVNRSTKAFGPFLSFIWATLVSLLAYGKKRIRLQLDDGPVRCYRVWNVAVANGRFHGGGMHVAPDACLDDGLFHVTIVGDLTLSKVFCNLHNLYNGRIYNVDGVTRETARRVRATSAQPVLLDVDGEQPGRLPLEADMIPAAVNILVGGESKTGKTL